MDNRRFLPYIIIGIVSLFLLFLLSSSVFVTIKSGQAGVLYKKFGEGTVTDRVYNEGFHIIAPWNTMYIYDVRIQEVKEVMDVLSRNGLSIKLELSLRYFPMQDQLGYIQKQFGQDYAEKIILPEIRSSARKLIGKYNPEELYSSKRESIQEEIFKETQANIAKKYIELDAVLIRSIVLPEAIQVAIQNKLKQEQESQEYEFRLEIAKKEAERKREEAKGIKDFQDIVSEGISDKLLKWKGIEATLDLAKSQNAKVVVIGQGKDGLPLILGNN